MRPITVDDGLSQSHVTCILQDRQGFIWVGTAVGLNRFDGLQFETFTHREKDRASISGDAIFALHQDSAGRIWVATDHGLDLFEPSSNGFQRFGDIISSDSRLRGRVRAIHSDTKGHLWLGLNGPEPRASYLLRFNPATRKVDRFTLPWDIPGNLDSIRALDEGKILLVARDATGQSYQNGFAVGVFEPATGKSVRFNSPSRQSQRLIAADERDISVAPGRGKVIWIGAPGAQVFRLDLAAGTLEPCIYDPALKNLPPSDLVSKVFSGSDGNLIVVPTWRKSTPRAGGSTIYTLGDQGELIRRSILHPRGFCDFTRSFVISGTVDRTGVLWTGISGAGMCVADLESGMFSHLHESSPNIGLSNNFVRSVWKTPEGVLWVGTRSGVNRIDRRGLSSSVIRHDPGRSDSLSDDEVKAVLVDRTGALWVGTQNGGLNRSPDQGRSFERYKQGPPLSKSISSNNVNALLEDRAGVLWIATAGGGVARFHPANRSFTVFRHVPGDPASLGQDNVTSLHEDSWGRMWVGTESTGLFMFDRDSGKFSPVDLGASDPLNIVSVVEDPRVRGVVWAATLRHGLVRYQPDSGERRWFTTENSILPSSTVYSMLADASGSVWAGTNKGLVRIDSRDYSFRIFATDQGLQSMEFNTRACFRAADGELLFGGIGGLNTFHLADITQNSTQPAVVITQVRTLNPHRGSVEGMYRTVYRNDGLPASGNLPAGSRELVFNYVALHYSDPARNRYSVKLEGYDRSWRDMGNLREATYTNLPPGQYRFLVSAVTSRGVWGQHQAAYSFTIARPVYLQPWFFALALAGTIGIALSAHRLRLRKLRVAKAVLEAQVDDRTRELSKALATIGEQADQLRDSDALKSRFITNISHDLRTPLTVTLGTLTDVRSGACGPVAPELAGQLDIVIRNEQRLLRLVNQMLAIARLDSGKLRIQAVECDLASLTREIIAIFRSAAVGKELSCELAAAGPVIVYCDPVWTGQAISNLISNAIKFSPHGGSIQVAAGVDPGDGKPFLSVHNNGPEISQDDLGRVFDRFFQSDAGAYGSSAGIGVGLSLAKEIVELHHGEISVSSEPGAGATFRISFLPGRDHFDSSQLASGSGSAPASGLSPAPDEFTWVETEPPGEADGDPDKPLLVIAEDDRDLREYIRGQFVDKYRVMTADSGGDAWSLIRSEVPDIVISDIMMPGMDGYQLCREMRNCPETDFIAIVLLTAKAEAKEKIEGLDCGADDYIVKPFDSAELQARVRNLLSGRQRLRTRITAELALDEAASQDGVPDSADAAFLRRVYETVRQHAHEQDFSVERMARLLTMSRMHLYRRLSAIAGKSPADLLMEYRLERAATLLGAQSGTVSEVAYGLGFKSVSHFTRRFREKFGHTPSDHRTRSRAAG